MSRAACQHTQPWTHYFEKGYAVWHKTMVRARLLVTIADVSTTQRSTIVPTHRINHITCGGSSHNVVGEFVQSLLLNSPNKCSLVGTHCGVRT